MSHCKSVFLLFCVSSLLFLGGCGGGGSSTASKNTASPVADQQTGLVTAQTRMNSALASGGNSNLLQPQDASYAIASAATSFQSVKAAQDKLLTAFYGGNNTQYDLIYESFMIQPSLMSMDYVFPIVTGDKGNVLASVSTVAGNRIAGYGYDILAGFDPSNTLQGVDSQGQAIRTGQAAHRSVFKRVLAWLVSGNASTDLTQQNPANLNIAWSSLPASATVMYTSANGTRVSKPYAVAGMNALLNGAFNSLSCDPLVAPLKDCASKAQLVVFGAIDRRLSATDLQTQLTRIQEIIAAKIPVLYLNAHPDGGAANDYARASFTDDFPRLNAMGFANGDIPDKRNYYVKDYVASSLTLEQLKQRADKIGGLLNSINTSSFKASYDWTSCPDTNGCTLSQSFTEDIVMPVNYLKGKLDEINAKGQNLFDAQNGNKTLQQFVLWADAYRKNIVYPIDKSKDPAKFQAAYIADALVAYVRASGSAQTDLGTFLSPAASQLVGSSPYETVTVSIPGKDGFTSVGRFALPGQAISFLLPNPPAEGKFSLFLNTAGSGNTKLFDAISNVNDRKGYRRPRFPQSPDFKISGTEFSIVSPYGGLLELRFSGANVSTVDLKIKGAVKQPFYDTTHGTADAISFFSDFRASKLGWMEIKTPGLEIHSLISKANELLQPAANDAPTTVYPNASKPYYSKAEGILMDKYLDETKRFVMEDAYRLAGFQTRGLTLNPAVSRFCSDHNWDCVSATIHKPPVVQHYHIDEQANCGWMCSGNPITSGGGFDPRGWGESHELGHNLQKFKIYDGMSGEVSNNIFPMHKKWRMRMELPRAAIGYGNELPDTQVVFDMLKNRFKDSSLSTDQKVEQVRSDLWSNAAYAAQNRLRLYFYLQWPLIYAEKLKAQNPSLTDAEAVEAGWDVFSLLYLNLRQVEAASDADWPVVKGKLGFGSYTSKPATSSAAIAADFPHHDYMLVVLSLITGNDQTPIFDLWGVKTTPAGKSQVAAMGLSPQPVKFYATRCADDFRGFQAVDLTQSNPLFPWPNEFKLSDNDNQAGTKQTTHNSYCKALTQ